MLSGNMSDSDDDSSDSSSDFYSKAFTSKDELTASFFSIKPAKLSQVESKDNKDDNDDDDDDDDDFMNVTENNELFSEVVKNLEATQRILVKNEDPKQHSSKDNSSQDIKGTKTDIKMRNISDEINAVLLQGESGAYQFSKNDEDTENEEDVKRPADYTIPKEGVKITLPGTSMFLKKKASKKESDLAAILRRKLKANQVLVEKVSRLCWLAHGFYLNRQANDPEIMTTVVSLVPTNSYPKDKFDLVYLEKFTKWFRNIFTVESIDNDITVNKVTLLKRIAEKKIVNYRELIVLYVAVLRGIGLNCRLIVSLNPPPVKAYADLLPKINAPKKTDQAKEKPRETKTKAKSSKSSSSKEDIKKTDPKKDNDVIQNSDSARKNANLTARKKAAEVLRSKYAYNKKDKDKLNNSIAQSNTAEVRDEKATSTSVQKADLVTSSRNLRSGKLSTAGSSTAKQRSNRNNSLENNQSKTLSSKRKTQTNHSDLSSGEEKGEKEEITNKAKKKRVDSNKTRTVTKSKKKNEKKESVSEDEEETDTKDKIKKTRDVWTEVYVESKGSWIAINVMDGNVDCVAEVYKKANKPVLYVIAYNSEGLIKDVTRRYCPHWLSVTHKQRIDEKWWTETVKYWPEKETTISKQEDELLLQKELEQPLPKTVGECKGHPLYVLVRHLLKYEALYPSDCVPLGHLHNGEAIYSRYCVHTLCSRETWLKKARVVKPKQDPYKIVKALPKYDKLSGMKLKNSALELFGEWQTTEYVPPEAKNGIVPRNEYGNVDLFKQCMLPKGTVHINLPGLNRIARKLNIDCASAVVGFNFGCMGAVPAIEGFVVCAEYEDTLRDAWETEQVEAAKRATEKREKRVYGNWRKLIKGLLIREKLSQKYEFLSEAKADQSSKRPKQRKGTVKKSKM
ncbi:PREDICTED: DNA repair protein complementing XP-C cells homolog [Dinoponera quadriceps]|uniref:DNA repair protein complementing XP-C cells homolog n=1 Tax=Dinoponera quadriceps TaxID=609295 RepID=A0A6P3X1B6_DINQU|nr:PREDICTED: DNA repair protein complementing XP-C cells homolog [Dinoponera quadriceps]